MAVDDGETFVVVGVPQWKVEGNTATRWDGYEEDYVGDVTHLDDDGIKNLVQQVKIIREKRNTIEKLHTALKSEGCDDLFTWDYDNGFYCAGVLRKESKGAWAIHPETLSVSCFDFEGETASNFGTLDDKLIDVIVKDVC